MRTTTGLQVIFRTFPLLKPECGPPRCPLTEQGGAGPNNERLCCSWYRGYNRAKDAAGNEKATGDALPFLYSSSADAVTP
ncbi:hypothetical protein BAUCODRAFT_118197 [Baudoinia panamericana UAMH 10762]|uniref:Uncharacterized protein n=1 Tax=Baudoinia panamericana (strain UAMH 10762) TaxID=717646 RepID=M2NML3_BAUPA|nr:uncharacterized protein BAUCODRAFT_118197 [Baudoinia panamericana UAMH 10762]EMD00426.1 hypothetical protein BAUCODRAFT_118197 [Baudoinia panamericana UAMH 10762]